MDLKVQVKSTQGAGDILLSHNWSTNGVFLRTRAPLKSGTEVELSVTLHKPHGRQVFRGVVHRSTSPDATDGRQGMVVTFEALPPGLARFLEETGRLRAGNARLPRA